MSKKNNSLHKKDYNYNLRKEVYGNIMSGFTFGIGTLLNYTFINNLFNNNKQNKVKCSDMFKLYNKCLFKNTSDCSNYEQILLINKCSIGK